MAIPQLITPLSDADKKRIVEKLKEKGVQGHCPMCNNTNFVLMDGYFSHPLQGNPSSGFVIGGPTIPSIAVVCSNCGFMSNHAVGALGLLPPEKGGAE
jgi:hypothetical protein